MSFQESLASFFKKPHAIQQLITVFLLWLCVAIITAVITGIRSDDPTAPFPANELTRFIDLKQLLIIAIAGAIVFSLFKAVGHRADSRDRQRSDHYADLALNEIGGTLYNFAALLAVSAYVGESKSYFIVSLTCCVAGYKLKPTEPSLANTTHDDGLIK